LFFEVVFFNFVMGFWVLNGFYFYKV